MLAARSAPKAKPVSFRRVLLPRSAACRCHPVSPESASHRMHFSSSTLCCGAVGGFVAFAASPATKSNRIRTCINRAPNLRRISTCEFFELKTLQNQHLQKNFEGGGDLRSYVRLAATIACRRRNADEKLPSPDEDRRRRPVSTGILPARMVAKCRHRPPERQNPHRRQPVLDARGAGDPRWQDRGARHQRGNEKAGRSESRA